MNYGPTQKRLREETSLEESTEKPVSPAETVDNLSPILSLPNEILLMIFAYTPQATKAVPDQALVRVSRQFRNQFGSFLMWRNGLKNDEQINQALVNQQATIQYLVNNKEYILRKTVYDFAVKNSFNQLQEATNHKMNDGCSFMLKEELINQLNAAIIRARINQSTDKDRLDCSGCHLTCIPASMLQDPTLHDYWSALTAFYLNDNRLAVLPPEIKQLVTLEYLSLDNNQITTFPTQIAPLEALKELTIQNNQLTTLPVRIGQWRNLSLLNLSHNQLIALPEQIAQLESLQMLDIAHNRITHISPLLADIIYTNPLPPNERTNLYLKITIAELMATQSPPQPKPDAAPAPEQKRLRNG